MKYLICLILIVFISCGNTEEVEKDLNGKSLKCEYETITKTKYGDNNDVIFEDSYKYEREDKPFFILYFGNKKLYEISINPRNLKIEKNSRGEYKQYVDRIVSSLRYTENNSGLYRLNRKNLSYEIISIVRATDEYPEYREIITSN